MQVNQIHPAISERASKQSVIVNALRDKIISGQWGPGARIPTHLELTEEFGVSSVTVQRGLDHLRNDGFIIPRGHLGSFVVDLPPHLHRYGMVLASDPISGKSERTPSTRFTNAMVQAGMKYSEESGQEFVFYTNIDNAMKNESYERLANDVRARRLAGLIFVTSFKSYDPELMRGSGIPSIGSGVRRAHNPDLPVFYPDADAFMTKALDFMVERGRKRVALMVISTMDVETIEHFRQEAAARGLETGPHSLIGLDPSRPEWARNALLMMMRQDASTRPDGLIIADDHLVSHTIQGIVESGLSNPRDLETVGYWNFTHNPPEASFITHLGFDVSEIVRTCIAQLNAQARGEKVPAVTRIAPVFGLKSVYSNVSTKQYSPAMNAAVVA